MYKLLVSDFIRMKKSLIFWTCVIGMFVFGVFASFSQYLEKSGDMDSARAENVAFGFNLIAGILCAAFCSVFQSEEYSEGTVRNKLVVGHTRKEIYISQMAISFLANIIICIAYIVPSLIAGMFFMGGFKELDTVQIISYYITGFMLVFVCTALFSFVTAFIQKKAGSVALCFLITLIIIYASLIIYQRLHTPEYTMRVINGVYYENAVNPLYPDAEKRKLLENIFDILPAGQAYQLCYRFADRTTYMIIWDSVIVCALSVMGVKCFKNKDLK